MKIFDYEDIQLIPNKCIVESRSECNTSVKFGPRTFKLPVVPANMQTVMNEELAQWFAENDYFYIMHRFNEENRIPFIKKMHHAGLFASISVGVKENEFNFIEKLASSSLIPEYITIDIAHGHSNSVINMIKHIKKHLPNSFVIAGNVGTPEGVRELENAGADATKVGIGPGRVCTTRVVAGVGVPQVTAIYDAAAVAREYGKTIIADGGIKYSGDIVKALAAGGNAVMLGSMLAGTDEAPGETEIFQGRKFKTYRGMGSIAAMKKGSSDRYFQGSVNEANKLVPEGIEGRVAYKGSVADMVFQMIGGIRSGMGYVGAATIQDLHDHAQFVEMSGAGLKESHPHDVQITNEAPNYSAQ